MKIRHIKKEAKATLKKLPGKYTLFLIPILIQFALIGLQVHKNHLIGEGVQMSLTASFFPILLNIIAGFFTLSAAFTMISVIRNKRQSVSFSDTSLAFSTDYFGKIIVLYLLKTLLILVWSLVLFLGLALLIISYFAYLSNAGGGASTNLSLLFGVLGFLITIVGLALSINRQLAYGMAEFLLFDSLQNGTYIGPLVLIEKSVAMMKGFKWKYFLLGLSFIGWYFLAIISLGLAYIYLLPYITTSSVYFYEHLRQEKNISNEQIPTLD